MSLKMPKSCLVAFSVIALGATACSGDADEKTSESPAPAPATTTVQAPASTVQQEPAPTVTVTQQETAPAPQPTQPAQPPQQPAFPTGQLVDSAIFKQGPNYYWTSPTGRIFCGVMEMQGEGYVVAGCQINAPSQACGDDPNVRQPMVIWGTEPNLQNTCTTQGVFAFPDSPALAYGQQINIGSFTAVSQQDGIYMRNTKTGEAFSIAVEGVKTFTA